MDMDLGSDSDDELFLELDEVVVPELHNGLKVVKRITYLMPSCLEENYTLRVNVCHKDKTFVVVAPGRDLFNCSELLFNSEEDKDISVTLSWQQPLPPLLTTGRNPCIDLKEIWRFRKDAREKWKKWWSRNGN